MTASTSRSSTAARSRARTSRAGLSRAQTWEKNKARVLANRVNLSYDLRWDAAGSSFASGQMPAGARASWRVPLPTAHELWSEIADPTREENPGPSCSSAEALRRQDLFVHDVLAAQAANLLWRLFRDGRIRHHGALCNLKTGFARPIPVPPSPHEDLEGGPRENASP